MKHVKVLAMILAVMGLQTPVRGETTTATSASGSVSTSGAGAAVDSSIDNAASNAGNNQSITYNSSIPDSQSIKTVPSSFAPALTTTLSETCMGSSAAGGSVLGFGFSAGSTWRDQECMRRLNARELANTLGDRQAARELMCGNEEVFRVYNALGRPCRLMPDGSANPDWKQDQAAVVAPRPPLEPFTVYFDSGKSDLSPIAMGELDRAAAAFNDRRSCCVKVVISGHTDRAGSAQANEELSAQRAEVARAYLTSKGIPPEVQLTVALGEKAPAVPTPDGVANPLNRRVEIIMGPWSGM